MIENIIQQTEETLTLPLGSIRGRCRKGPIAIGRLVAYKVARDLGYPSGDITREIRRSRGYQYHLERESSNLYEVDRNYRCRVELIKTLCYEKD